MRVLARCFGVGLLFVSVSCPVLAQSGGGGAGGAVGGVIGGVGGAIGGAGGTAGGVVGGAGGAVGGVSNSIGGIGGPLGGGLSGPLGGIPTTINGVGDGIAGGSNMIGGRFVDTVTPVADELQISRHDIELELESNLNELGYALWAHVVPPATLAEMRKLRLKQLVNESGGYLEFNAGGEPVVRGRLLALDPTKAALSAARKAGFKVVATDSDPVFGTSTVVLAVPVGMSTQDGMVLIHRVSPKLAVEFDHAFEPAGGSLAATSVALAGTTAAIARTSKPLIGIIDGGAAQSPALENASIEQKGFVGPAQATGHGTAVASLIVGSNGKFRGAAPGADLLVADVYGGNPAAGSALAIAKALSWLASQQPQVINISLVGPRNQIVERAVNAVQARGIKVVAAVGNDGPAAPPQYPASQPGVVAVTGVDATNRALAEAGKSLHLDYSAPGADMAAALPGSGYANVRGTSFAAPLVSARLALTGSTVKLDAEASKKGFGQIGRGIVCGTCRVAPKLVKAK